VRPQTLFLSRPRACKTAAFAAVSASLVAASAALGQATAPPAAKADSEINKPFVKPDVPAFVKRFETESREVYVQRKAIVEALGLKRGSSVADVGAGTGLFTRLMAAKVGPEGRVYAVDVAQEFLTHIANDARRLGQTQVRTVLGSQATTNLPKDSIELAFLCDVYHHLENPERTLASIHRALKPEGTLVVVDFDRVKGKSSEFVHKHVRAEKAVFIKEIQAAGFVLDPVANPPGLKENFFLRFRKAGGPAASD